MSKENPILGSPGRVAHLTCPTPVPRSVQIIDYNGGRTLDDLIQYVERRVAGIPEEEEEEGDETDMSDDEGEESDVPADRDEL